MPRPCKTLCVLALTGASGFTPSNVLPTRPRHEQGGVALNAPVSSSYGAPTRRRHRSPAPQSLSMATVEADTAGALIPVQQQGGALSTAASLERVLSNMNEGDRYNAVIQGLSSVALSKSAERRRSAASSSSSSSPVTDPVVEILQLLAEMRENKVRCSVRSCGAVIDAATATTDVSMVDAALSAIRGAGAGQKFGRDMPRMSLLPSDPKRRARAMAGKPPLPSDERGLELGYAGAFIGFAGLDLGAEGLGPVMHYDTTVPTLLGFAVAAGLALDMVKRSGEITGPLLRGLNRLFLRDVVRESRCEGAAFLTAYLTGLPCFAFEPNVYEAVRMAQKPSLREALDSPGGVHRVLVWLLAPVAAEAAVHRQLVCSDPRQALAFLSACRQENVGGGAEALDPTDDQARLDWAYNEARALLRDNEAAFDALRARLETGGATVGECVSLLERLTR